MQTLFRMTTTRAALTLGTMLSLAAASHAVTPQKFTQTTEADFADGDAYGTVVTNLGDIKLSSDTTPIEGLPEDVTVIHDVVKTDEGVYIAAGPEARVLLLREGKVIEIAKYENEQVFAMTAVGSDLFVGISSNGNTRVELLDQGEVKATIKLPDTTYVWDLAWIDDKIVGSDEIIIATGPEGKVFRVTEDTIDKPEVVLDTQQDNALSLAADGKGQIYVGTDGEGLIYRVDREGNPFVVYDAPEAEVAALAVGPAGNLYAGTAAADQAKPGRLAQPQKEEQGRPEPEPEPEVQEVPEQQPEEPAEPEAEAAPAPKPTPEQYDALRENLKERLEAARESGKLDGDADDPANAGAAPSRPSRAKPAAPAKKKPGNAVYRISPDGFVTEVFRESAMILAIVPNDDRLIVATGNEGQVFSVDPKLRETTVLADLESSQVTCAVSTDEGLLLGAANPGALMRMDTAVAKQGGYTSKVLDAGQVSLFGTFKLTAGLPEGTTVSIELRSGNVGDPEQGAWSKWTKATLIEHNANANPLQPIEIKTDVPPARYLQYRLTLTGDGKATPVVDQADLAYVAPNTPPTVAKLIIKPAPVKAPGTDPDPKLPITWQATDDNKDRLVYTLEYKPGKADRYLPLAKDLKAPKYDWQTQHVPDGWYTLRVTAHDKLDNPADSSKSGGRVSEPILIDNTDPDLKDLKAQALGGGKVRLTATVADELSAITSVAYSIDGSDTYQASLPDDLIYDSTSEPWGVTISDLSPGGHVIAVRAIDARGNTAYRQLIVEVQ